MWRVDANGETHGIWPNPTIYPGTPGGSNGEAAFAPDGAGGFIAVWRDYRNGSQAVALYAQHITAAGAIAPGWPDSGAALSGPGEYGLLAVPDGSGGAFVMWARPYSQLNVQHISGAGEVAQPGGVQIVGPVVGTQDRGILVPDGVGGAIVVWVDRWNAGIDPYNYDLFAQRFDRGLNFAWGPTGAEVTKAPRSQDYPVALPDGAGGAFIAWPDRRNSSSSSSLKQEIYGLHLTPNGTRAPGWAQGGNPIRISSWAEDPRIATDGAGGALISSVAWQSGGAYIIEIDDVTPSGGKTSFRSLSIPLMMGDTGLNDFRLHDMIGDGNGGAFVAWTTTDYADFVLHLGPDGEPAPGWDLQGARVDGRQWDYVGGISLAPDGASGAFVLFERAYDERVPHEPTYLEYLYATRVLSGNPNPLEVPPSVAPHFALGGARPNPAGREFTVAFELPDASPAWIELMDLAGRRIVAREVGTMGPGEHLLRLGDSRDLVPGLYHVRLTRGGRSLTARVALIR